jgi:hypothetical protein
VKDFSIPDFESPSNSKGVAFKEIGVHQMANAGRTVNANASHSPSFTCHPNILFDCEQSGSALTPMVCQGWVAKVNGERIEVDRWHSIEYAAVLLRKLRSSPRHFRGGLKQ